MTNCTIPCCYDVCTTRANISLARTCSQGLLCSLTSPVVKLSAQKLAPSFQPSSLLTACHSHGRTPPKSGPSPVRRTLLAIERTDALITSILSLSTSRRPDFWASQRNVELAMVLPDSSRIRIFSGKSWTQSRTLCAISHFLAHQPCQCAQCGVKILRDVPGSINVDNGTKHA